MIVDFHTHIFPDALAPKAIPQLSLASGTLPYTDGTEAGLLHSMAQCGITHSVVLPVATNPQKVSSVNRAAVLEKEDGAIIHFGAMHPDCPTWKEELRLLADNGCKGIKIHPVYQGVDLDDIRYLRILNEAGALGMSVVTHTGDDIGFPGVVHCSPAMALNAVKQVGPVKLVLAHMGGWHCWDKALDLLCETSVYIDTSFSFGAIALRPENAGTDLGLLTKEKMLTLIRTFGADRILFGTDSPWAGQAQTLAELRSLGLKDNELDSILWKNAASLLHI